MLVKILKSLIIFVVLLGCLALAIHIKFIHSTHLSYLSKPNTFTGKAVYLWYETCPDVEESYYPNSVFGAVVAGREMFGDQFEVIIDILLKCKHDIDMYDSIGLTPLHAAILIGDLASVGILISKGSNKKVATKGEASEKYGELTALEFAETFRGKSELHDSIFEYLAELP